MTSVFHKIAGLFQNNHVKSNITMLGLDSAGKTTIIYKMCKAEVTTVIPTIGFNLEEVTYKNIHFRCWDVGGCDKIRPLWRHYFENTDALIYVIDSNDIERIEEARKEFDTFMDELKNIMNKHVYVLVYFNKQDLPHSRSSAELWDKMNFSEHQKDHIIHAQPSCATTGEGLYEGFDWLAGMLKQGPPKIGANAVEVNGSTNDTSSKNSTRDGAGSTSNSTSNSNGASTNNPAPPKREAPPPPQPPFLSPSDAFSNDEFLQHFENYTLPSWDHKTHIRIAYLNLKKYGRREGVRKIRSGLQNFIANSSITNRNRYHETMTYFWIQMVHYAMSMNNMPLVESSSKDRAENLVEFDTFLEKNTQLMNGGLFLEYYSRDLMLNNANSRAEFAIPDIKPLPNIVNAN